MLIQIIGWLGSVCLAICAVPQVVKTFRTKKIDDISWGFLLLWFSGEVFTLSYLFLIDYRTGVLHFPLYVNYAFNITLLFYLLYAKVRYK